jgi:uncharacterized membrane protein
VNHVWFLIRWLHLLAMAFFVGGQMMLAAVVVPVARRSADCESLRAIARRFGQGTLVALGILIATGTALAFHLHLWSNHTFELKLALVLIICVLLTWHIRRPDRAQATTIFWWGLPRPAILDHLRCSRC